MKLLDLLEGSDKLFHLTKLEKLSDILVSGGLLCSTMNDVEAKRVSSRLGIEGKIFYLSMARSMRSSFIRNQLRYNESVVCFEIDGSKLSRYGRVLPINFFNRKREDTFEMEDRLIGDRGLLEFSSGIFTGIRIFIQPGNRQKWGDLFSELGKYGIPMKFFRNAEDFSTDRNWVGIDEWEDGEFVRMDDNHVPWYKLDDGTKFLEDVLKYLDGGMPDDVKKFQKGCGVLEYQVDKMLHKLMVKNYKLVRKLYLRMRELDIKSDQRDDFFRMLARNVKDGVKFSEPEK